jgi:hypothetical protein
VIGIDVGGALMGRSIGLDVHRDFCQVAIADGTGRARREDHDDARAVELFAHSLAPTDRVVMEATVNALAIAGTRPYVAEVLFAHAGRLGRSATLG